jgi:hypothetical protein
MRILNYAEGAPLDNICVYLTSAEATQMIEYLEQLLAEPDQHHFHLNDDEYQREIRLTVYDPAHLNQYDARSKKLIQAGEWNYAAT